MESFKYFWEDFTQNKEMFLGSYVVSEEEILNFARKFDPQYFHTDPLLAKDSSFGGLIACGWHTCSIMMRLMCDNFLNQTSSMGAPAVDDLKWLLPLRPGDIIDGFWDVVAKRESKSKPNLGIIKARIQGFNQEGNCIITMEPTLLVFKRSRNQSNNLI